MNSEVVTKGARAGASRSFLYATGLTKEELQKPLIAVVSSFNEVVPGHINIDKIANAVKMGIAEATAPSKAWAMSMASVESAIRSRVTREYFMPTCPMAIPSHTAMAGNMIGV